MKGKQFNILLIITSLMGYLRWAPDMHAFLFQLEAEIISKLLADPMSVLHPLTILPMLGQIGLLITLFQKQPSKILTYVCIGCLGILLVLMFAIGVMVLDWKIIGSTIPFIVVAIMAIRYYRSVSMTA